MALSTKPWSNFDESSYKDAPSYCDACLVNNNSGPRENWTKAQCHLPVREPGGALNRNGMLAAQGALMGARGGVDLSPEDKRKAMRKLAGMMRANGMQPSESMQRMMGG